MTVIYGYTLKAARILIREAGCVIRRTDWGEYRVNFRGGKEATAYYTTDLTDAVDTARAMSKGNAVALGDCN